MVASLFADVGGRHRGRSPQIAVGQTHEARPSRARNAAQGEPHASAVSVGRSFGPPHPSCRIVDFNGEDALFGHTAFKPRHWTSSTPSPGAVVHAKRQTLARNPTDTKGEFRLRHPCPGTRRGANLDVWRGPPMEVGLGFGREHQHATKGTVADEIQAVWSIPVVPSAISCQVKPSDAPTLP